MSSRGLELGWADSTARNLTNSHFTLVLDDVISEGGCMHYTMQAETFFLYLKNKLRSYSEVQ
jgi:hypothetical protein